jgi:hypothetical protein
MQRIKSLGVLSCAKMSGAIYGCLGLIFVPFALIGGLAGMASGQGKDAIGGIIFLVFGILAPVIYGAMGFVLGAFSAWIYNLMAKWLGGIQIELQQIPMSAANQAGTV